MDPKTALVLSAGGMFGAYQAGVWQFLAGRFRPSVVVGVSVGALNGWAIAGGCPPEELAGYWLDPHCAALARPRLAPPWRGLLDAEPLHRQIRSVWSQFHPRCEMVVVATEWPRLRLRLFVGEEIRWQHLAASCAVPLCYPPVRIGAGRYCDGGLLAPVPVWVAADMGAKRVVLVNLLPKPVSRGLRLAVRVVQAVAPQKSRPPAETEVLAIAPSAPLGRLRDSLFWCKANVERWLRQGRSDAERLADRLAGLR